MAVSAVERRSPTYFGNGVTTEFAYGFKILAETDLEVRQIDAAGATTILALNTDYTVSGAGADSGGIVTLAVAPSTAERLIILGAQAFSQSLVLVNQGPYFAADVMRALDRNTILAQQLNERLSRAVTLPPESTVVVAEKLVSDIVTLADISDDVTEVARISPAVSEVAAITEEILAVPGLVQQTDADATATAADRVQTGQDRVATGEDRAAAAVSAEAAAASAGFRDFADVTTLLTLTAEQLSYGAGASQVAAGDVIRTRAEGFSYEVAAEAATDQHVTTAGGVKLYRLGNGILYQNGEFNYKLIAGALRNNAGVWEFLDDTGHSPIGVDSVSVVGDEIIINFASIGATKVVSFVVSPDERLARDGIIAGASVSTTEARVRVGAPLNFWANVDTQAVTTSPWWDGDITVSVASDYFEITHPSVDTSIYLATDRIGSATSRQIEMGQTRESTTKTRIYPRTDIYGYLYYDGAAWNESFMNVNFHPAISTAFTSGELIVTHPSNGGDYDLTITGRAPYAALADGFGSTNFQVQFYSFATGAQVTVEDTNMRFYFNRKNVKNINAGAIDIPVGNWSFKAPTAWLKDPNKLTTALANFWVVGVMEVDTTA